MKKHASNVSIVGIVFILAELISSIVLAIQFESVWIFVGGAVSATVMAIFVFSYSALLSEMGDQSEMIQKILIRLDNQDSKEEPSKPSKNAKVNDTSAEKVTSEKRSAVVTPKADTTDPDYVICPACGKRQRSNRSVCLECGAVFKA